LKTIRLLYPDYVSGGLDTYYFGAQLLTQIVPANPSQPLITVDVRPPDGLEKPVKNGISGLEDVLWGIQDAQAKIAAAFPDRIITLGGNCLVSLAPFDYLHGLYPNVGIVWIDAHPDVSTPENGYPNAHAMVLGSLLGGGAEALRQSMTQPFFAASDILYIGLQGLHSYQQDFLQQMGVAYKVQTEHFVQAEEIRAFTARFDHLLVHFDIDVLDETLFHSTYFANKDLVGDGAGGGKMTMEALQKVLHCVCDENDVVGLTIAEYLPFDEHSLHKVLSGLHLFTDMS